MSRITMEEHGHFSKVSWRTRLTLRSLVTFSNVPPSPTGIGRILCTSSFRLRSVNPSRASESDQPYAQFSKVATKSL